MASTDSPRGKTQPPISPAPEGRAAEIKTTTERSVEHEPGDASPGERTTVVERTTTEATEPFVEPEVEPEPEPALIAPPPPPPPPPPAASERSRPQSRARRETESDQAQIDPEPAPQPEVPAPQPGRTIADG